MTREPDPAIRTLRRADGGQASAELVAVVPLVLVVALAIAQLVTVGYALWTAAGAARAGARAQLIGGDPERAALSALPGWLEQGAKVERGMPLAVSVAAPALLPGLPSIRVAAGSALDPSAGTGPDLGSADG